MITRVLCWSDDRQVADRLLPLVVAGHDGPVSECKDRPARRFVNDTHGVAVGRLPLSP
jgi:hypothetical protein